MAMVKQALLGVMALGITLPTAASEAWNFYVGLGGSVQYYENSGREFNPPIEEYNVLPNLQAGITRPINERWSLSTGLELLAHDLTSWGNSGNVLNWRVGELTYQINDKWATSFYGGIGRFYRNNPAYGYDFGVGVIYQLSPSWVVSTELSYLGTDTSINNDVPFKRDKFAWGTVSFKYRF